MMLMKRVFQDYKGEITFVKGKTIERLICVMVCYPERNETYPCVFWLKVVEEEHWNRFFVDSICVYWEIYPSLEQDDLEDQENFPVCETGEQFGLHGVKVIHTEVQDVAWEGKPASLLRMMFSSGQELVVRANEDHAEMEVLLSDEAAVGPAR